MQMGTYAAKRIGLLIANSDAAATQKPFRYFDKGDMATIGRKAAVARIIWPFKANLSGFMAWMIWMFVHIFFLIGFSQSFLGLPQLGVYVHPSAGRCPPHRRLAGASRLERLGAPSFTRHGRNHYRRSRSHPIASAKRWRPL